MDKICKKCKHGYPHVECVNCGSKHWHFVPKHEDKKLRPLTKTEIEQRFTDNVAVYVRIGDDNQLIPAILDTTDRGSFAIWCSDSKEWLCISSYGDRWVAYDYSGGEPVCGKEFEMQEGIE